jgi:hypothetical protein
VSSSGRRPDTSLRVRAQFLASLEASGRSPASPDGLIERLGAADDQLAICEHDESRAADVYRQCRADWLERNEGTDPELATSAAMHAQRSLTPGDRHCLALMYAAEVTWDRARAACELARTRRNTLLAAYDRLSDPLHPLTFDDEPDGLSPSDRSRW